MSLIIIKPYSWTGCFSSVCFVLDIKLTGVWARQTRPVSEAILLHHRKIHCNSSQCLPVVNMVHVVWCFCIQSWISQQLPDQASSSSSERNRTTESNKMLWTRTHDINSVFPRKGLSPTRFPKGSGGFVLTSAWAAPKWMSLVNCHTGFGQLDV